MMRDENQCPPSLADMARLPPMLDVPTAAQWLKIGRTTAYALAKAGAFPVPVLRIGGTLRVPTAPLARLLGLAYPAEPVSTLGENEPESESPDDLGWEEPDAFDAAGDAPVAREVPRRTGLRRTGRWSVDRGRAR